MSKLLDMLLRGRRDDKKKASMGKQSATDVELPSPKYENEDATVEMPTLVDKKDRLELLNRKIKISSSNASRISSTNSSISNNGDQLAERDWHKDKSEDTKALENYKIEQLMPLSLEGRINDSCDPNFINENRQDNLDKHFIEKELTTKEDNKYSQSYEEKSIETNSSKSFHECLTFEELAHVCDDYDDNNIGENLNESLDIDDWMEKRIGLNMKNRFWSNPSSTSNPNNVEFKENKVDITLDDVHSTKEGHANHHEDIQQLRQIMDNLDNSNECNYLNSGDSEDLELQDFEGLPDDLSDCEDELSLKELRELNKTKEVSVIKSTSLFDHDADIQSIVCDTYKKDSNKLDARNSTKISNNEETQVKHETFGKLHESISQTQPFLQDNVRGSSMQGLKLEMYGDVLSQGESSLEEFEPYFDLDSMANNFEKESDKHNNFEDARRSILNERKGKTNLLERDLLSMETQAFIDELHKKYFTISGPPLELPKETREFLEKIKNKSCARLASYQQIVDRVIDLTPDDLKHNLEAIETLENELHEQETRALTILSTKTNNGNVSIPRTNENVTQNESNCHPSQTTRDSEVLEVSKKECPNKDNGSLATKKTRKVKDKILRNIRLGPDARYYRLTDEEEAIVERILAEFDVIEAETNDGSSTISFASTGYDFDGDDAKRIAEIDAKLEQLSRQHSRATSTGGSHCDDESSDGYVSTFGVGFTSRATTSQNSLKRTHSETTKDGTTCAHEKDSTRSKKLHRDHTSVVTSNAGNGSHIKDYLLEQRIRREIHERTEEIDRKLQELETGPRPKLSDEELAKLVSPFSFAPALQEVVSLCVCIDPNEDVEHMLKKNKTKNKTNKSTQGYVSLDLWRELFNLMANLK